MDDLEARVRCVEAAVTLAAQLRPMQHNDAQGVVEIATTLYHFCNAPPVVETQHGNEDKPRRGRPPKVAQD